MEMGGNAHLLLHPLSVSRFQGHRRIHIRNEDLRKGNKCKTQAVLGLLSHART